jgi:glycosyltransferase involved in cell wall biosynthesis/SAM-dependent methyltransferase
VTPSTVPLLGPRCYRSAGSLLRSRCLFVIHYPVFGGPHNQALRLARPLEERGWETVVLLPAERGNAAARLREGGVDVVEMQLGRVRAARNARAHARFAAGFAGDVRRLRRAIRETRADLVQIGGLVNPQAAVAARLEGVPVVWQILDTRAPRPLRLASMPLVERLADALMFDGEALVDLHADRRTLDVPWYVFYPPVDTDRFAPSAERRGEVRSRFGLPDDAPVVGTVSNVSPQKGLEDFAAAAGLVHASRPDACFLVVGATYETHAAYTARVLDAIRASGVPSEQFVLAGDRADVERFYAAMDVKAIASIGWEGTTTTAQEAMACGVPVVATDVGAVSEVVADGHTGLLVPPRDPAALAAALLELLGDGGRRASMGEAGRARAVERFGVGLCADVHVAAFEAALRRREAQPASSASLAERDLRSLLVCPSCRGELAWSDETASCTGCGASYPVVDSIPVLVATGSPGEEHRLQQAGYFDSVDAEYEITRPHGTPSLHRWLLDEKFRRGVSRLRPLLHGATVASVCGGSGMDADYLARSGARVIVADISLGAARRVRERARRFGLPITSVVADAEALPFRDGGVDVGYVHDGLHHLERPLVALAELGRVAASAVSINEPARAAATRLAVALGIAYEREEAGNRVERLDPADVARALEAQGFRVVAAERYGMYYRHEPGRLAKALSFAPLAAGSRVSIAAFNRVAGGIGNKLTVQAIRAGGDSAGAAGSAGAAAGQDGPGRRAEDPEVQP